MAMASPLLETKIYIPRPHRGVVPRPRLLDRLNRGSESKLTLVSAPAGFGKTTLLAEWLAAMPANGGSAGWLSLDPSDSEPASFWTYLIAALQTAAPEVGATSLSLLRSPQPPGDAVLAALLNELNAISNDVVLVLDDYHVIDSPEVQDGMAFLIDHLPPRVHLVIATRADPGLPLARLRARGELLEIRAADLRFTPDEAAAYLNDVMGLAVTAQDVVALERRTEGWIAALQLAAISMQGRDDIPGFIAGFAGDDRYIVDYLIEEVLRRQPDHVRSFLLRTAVLSRLTGALCDAVTGESDGRSTLEALDRGNLFLVPLDDRRRWYRYHHLFADMLRARLLDEQPELVPELHRRASHWYEQNGERSEAISHALAAEDFARAADLIELAIPAMRSARQESAALRWLKALPDDVIALRPVLSVHYAGALLLIGQFDRVEPRLRDAERWLSSIPDLDERPNATSPSVVVDGEEFRSLAGTIAMYRAAVALGMGNVADTMYHARRVPDLVPEDDDLRRASAAGLLGLAYWTSGDLGAAHRSYSECVARLRKIGYFSDILGCTIALADIRIAQGRLRDAMSTYERGLQLVTEQDPAPLRGAPDMHVGMSELLRERNRLDAALQHLHAGKELGEHAGMPQNRYRWRVAMARIRKAEGNLDSALELLDEAERLYVGDLFPNVRPIAAQRAQVWIAQGHLDAAVAWARERGLSPDGDLTYLREFEHITLARVLMASRDRADDRDEALALLLRLLHAAEAGQRTGSVIEILVLQALAQAAEGDGSAALGSLEGALTLAEPEGYVRVFVDEGPSMAALLEAAASQGIAPNYVRQLLSAFGRTEDRKPFDQSLIEPLSERELEVLRLLATDLDGPEIARELVVSLHTVRSHTKSIYAKLGVNNRRTAVRRAEELDLLSRNRH